MVNVRKLKSMMVLREKSAKELAKLLKVAPCTFYRKLQHPEKLLTIGDAGLLATQLGLSDEDICEIFFAGKVA